MIVAILPSVLFPPKKGVGPVVGRPAAARDSTAILGRDNTATAQAGKTGPVNQPTRELPTVRPAESPDSQVARVVTVESPLYRYEFSTRGARLKSAVLKSYRSFAKGEGGPAQIIPDSSELLAYRVVVGVDTTNLGNWTFDPSVSRLDVASGSNELDWVGRRGNSTVTLKYRFTPDNYLFSVAGD